MGSSSKRTVCHPGNDPKNVAILALHTKELEMAFEEESLVL
jgi:hypothetical protein